LTAALDRLSLMQWLSPAFPTGGFAYSHGLEQVISDGQVRTAADVQGWLSDVLSHGTGRGDAMLLVAGLTPEADRDGLDDIARALAPSAERLHETLPAPSPRSPGASCRRAPWRWLWPRLRKA
jgi:urease accessory protein